MKRWRIRRTTKKHILQIIGVTILCLAVLFGGYYLIIHKMKTDFEVEKQELLAERDANKRYVYIAKDAIRAGTIITEEYFEEVYAYAGMENEYYISDDDMGKVLLLDIPQGTQVLKSMVSEQLEAKGMREVESDVIGLNNNLVDGDYVDIRLALPNGEDYIVLAKKSVHDLKRDESTEQLNGVCYLWLNEEEILYLSASIVDAYLYQGAILYTTRYIEPSIQEASLVTYVPSLASIELISQDENILTKAKSEVKENLRKSLENRLAEYLNKNVSEIVWSVDSSRLEEEAQSDKENRQQEQEAIPKQEINKGNNGENGISTEEAGSEEDALKQGEETLALGGVEEIEREEKETEYFINHE
ncbi:MAG: hypothetical protein E7256_13140 [Lachnospiraceae bacterium]|nr:hypothetical protein [Lachnospiraceae bacterium]